MNGKAALTPLILLTLLACGGVSRAEQKLWFEPRAKVLPLDKPGQFVQLEDGSLLTVGHNFAITSKDDGKTWSEPRTIYDGPKPGIPSAGLLLRTRDGVIVLVYMDLSTQRSIVSGWDAVEAQPPKGGRRAVWTIRSLDKGETWVDRQKIFEGYCGALIDIIQTTSGHVVVPVQRMLLNPGRHGQCTYVSTDDGKTWKRSSIIDIGGRGFEDGAFEGTVGELSDGRLLMFMRTTLDYFWKAYSDDNGLSWRVIGPSKIDASNAPGYLIRLASGRLALVWNRLALEGKEPIRGSGGRDQLSHHQRVDVSWQRLELSLAFSEDDGNTWTKPVVIVRASGGEVCYPYILERSPGQLWITARNGANVHLSIREEDFVGK